jgi:hypothetical protein
MTTVKKLRSLTKATLADEMLAVAQQAAAGGAEQ